MTTSIDICNTNGIGRSHLSLIYRPHSAHYPTPFYPTLFDCLNLGSQAPSERIFMFFRGFWTLVVVFFCGTVPDTFLLSMLGGFGSRFPWSNFGSYPSGLRQGRRGSPNPFLRVILEGGSSFSSRISARLSSKFRFQHS